MAKAVAVTGEVQTGDEKNVITNMKISDATLTGTVRQMHVAKHYIQRSVDSLKVDTERKTTCLCVRVCV